MSPPEDRTASATVVLAQRVRPGLEEDFETWQNGINAAARKFRGFEAAEVVRPVTGVQDDYVIVYRFDSADTLEAWVTSDERADWVTRGEPLFAAAPVQHTIATPRSNAVTVVVTHRVKPGGEKDYREWQHGIDGDVRQFRGFVSTEVFEPSVDQKDWVVVFRFDSADNLQYWLDSDVRAAWLDKAAPLLDSWDLHKVSGGLGGWFQVSEDGTGARTAPAWKQAMTVMVALYPTVMVLRLLLTPHIKDLATPVLVLISNIASVIVLTWALMPAATRSLRWWLDPRASQRTSAIGALAVMSFYAAATGLFLLIS